MAVEDILKLAEESGDHVWEVSFCFRSSEYEGEGWICSFLTVLSSGDGRDAIAKVSEYVNDKKQFGMKVDKFKIRGLKLRNRVVVK